MSASVGSPPVPPLQGASPTGEFCEAFGRRCYRITRIEQMPPFLVNLVSASDLWMFVASNGGLTAGRVDANGAVFPYHPVDRVYDSAGISGPVTAVAVSTAAGEVIWNPFVNRIVPPRISRQLYKSVEGDALWFEEIDADLGLAFRYGWMTAEQLGFIRRCELVNLTDRPRDLRLLDGLRNLLPAGIPQRVQSVSSNLADAYKTSELLPGTTLAIHALAATIVDQPLPVEALRASVVWSGGLPGATILLSDVQTGAFFRGEALQPETRRRGLRCGYFLNCAWTLPAGATERWFMVTDTGLDHAAVSALHRRLQTGDPAADVEAGVRTTTERLRGMVGDADGLQHGGDEVIAVHHFANVLFNVMRGGTFGEGSQVPAQDFADYLALHNRAVAQRHAAFLHELPSTLSRTELLARVWPRADPDLARLASEYLPLMFSRRHGDPSRPWNRFSIRLQDAAGRRLLAYEGNWRDIFQNWEALSLSYPEYLDAFIAKFLNASTADGFNPYRISNAEIDWEVPDPEDPWSSIGYWGDHQVIYLLKLLEWSDRYQPELLPTAMRQARYSYANVPYRIADYATMRQNPRSTIRFDAALHRSIVARMSSLGSDARLLTAPSGEVLHVNLTEKLLVLALARLTNFIPDGGIWMNTQRPEWNDANNALVGYGVSVVTLCYLRRFLAHCQTRLLPALGEAQVPVSAAVIALADRVDATLATHTARLTDTRLDDTTRRALVDGLAAAGSEYRARLYAEGPGPIDSMAGERIRTLFGRALEFVDHSIRANFRPDGLAHSYNQLEFASPTSLVVHHLPLMLEGQVAVLSAGTLAPREVVALLEALRRSPLYRADQHSYLLYPDRVLPGFMERNRIADAAWAACPLFADMLQAGETRLVLEDAAGIHRFAADLETQAALEQRLAQLAAEPRWAGVLAEHAGQVREVYEEVFRHRAFTGRSGSMFGFEGLGCIYWHMVAKLLLAAQENLLAADAAGAPETKRLIKLYYDIRAGIGFNKTPAVFGAFPTDPYSHTPGHAGAQQPGMTGQVKEEILTRWGELGVRVSGGLVSFRPTFLRANEFTTAPGSFLVMDCKGQSRRLDVPARALGFTCAGTPVIYHRTGTAPGLRIFFDSGEVRHLPGNTLDRAASEALFNREGLVARLEVDLGEDYRPLD